MIVFWRLFLAVTLTDFVFFHKAMHQQEREARVKAMVIRAVSFAVLALLFCHRYLTEGWPFLEEVTLPGWVCILLFAAFHGFTDHYFQLGGKIKYGYTISFFLKNFINTLFLVLIAPFRTLYEISLPNRGWYFWWGFYWLRACWVGLFLPLSKTLTGAIIRRLMNSGFWHWCVRFSFYLCCCRACVGRWYLWCGWGRVYMPARSVCWIFPPGPFSWGRLGRRLSAF